VVAPQWGRHGVGNDPEYIHTRTFETFPFPEGLTPDIPATAYAEDPRAKAVAAAGKRLNELRENWLNPADLVVCVREVVAGYPDRFMPADDKARAELKRRTLTNLYNERPTWLVNAHRDLDAVVAAAYGWIAEITDGQILDRLLKLNQGRTAKSPATSSLALSFAEEGRSKVNTHPPRKAAKRAKRARAKTG
jgi:type II restriction/modification system DNA methylase subunit YeeA